MRVAGRPFHGDYGRSPLGAGNAQNSSGPNGDGRCGIGRRARCRIDNGWDAVTQPLAEGHLRLDVVRPPRRPGVDPMATLVILTVQQQEVNVTNPVTALEVRELVG